MMTAGRTCNGAFTLVEVLVVVCILAILAAILGPALRQVLQQGQMAQSLSNLRQLATANTAYASDHLRYCPADDRWNNKRWHGARSSASQPFDPTKGFLSNYLGKSRKVGICPLFREKITGATSFEMSTGGYGYNASYVGGTPMWSYDSSGARVAAMPSQIDRLNTVMFATSGYANGDSIQEYPYVEPPFWDFGSGLSGWRPSPTVHFRFNDKALVAWCDGRVTSEPCESREVGFNPHGGDADTQKLGWFGPDEENGFWNPKRSFDQSSP